MKTFLAPLLAVVLISSLAQAEGGPEVSGLAERPHPVAAPPLVVASDAPVAEVAEVAPMPTPRSVRLNHIANLELGVSFLRGTFITSSVLTGAGFVAWMTMMVLSSMTGLGCDGCGRSSSAATPVIGLATLVGAGITLATGVGTSIGNSALKSARAEATTY